MRVSKHCHIKLVIALILMLVIVTSCGRATAKKETKQLVPDGVYEISPKGSLVYLKLFSDKTVVIEYADVTRSQKDYNDDQSPVTVNYVFGSYKRTNNGSFKIASLTKGIEIDFADKKSYAKKHAYKTQPIATSTIKTDPELKMKIVRERGRLLVHEPKYGYFYWKPAKRKLPKTEEEAKKFFTVDLRYKSKRYVNDGGDD